MEKSHFVFFIPTSNKATPPILYCNNYLGIFAHFHLGKSKCVSTYQEQRQCWYTGTGFQNRPPLSQLLWGSPPIEVQPGSKIEVYPNLLYVAIIEPYCSSSTGQPLCHPGGLQGLHLHRQIQPRHLLEGGTPIRCENVLNLFLFREYVVLSSPCWKAK